MRQQLENDQEKWKSWWETIKKGQTKKNPGEVDEFKPYHHDDAWESEYLLLTHMTASSNQAASLEPKSPPPFQN